MLAILRRFKASVTKLHSPCTFFSPRSENCRNPNTCFTHPNAGSTIPLRRRYCRFPRWSFNRFTILRRGPPLSTDPSSCWLSRPCATNPRILRFSSAWQFFSPLIPRVRQHPSRLASRVFLHLIHQRRQRLIVRRTLPHLLRHDQLIAFLHHRLRVVALLETLFRLHDAALGIAEIALRGRLRLAKLPLEFRAASLRPFPRSQLMVAGLAPFLLVLLLLLGFQRRLRRPDRFQPLLSPPQFFGQLVPAVFRTVQLVFGGVGLLRFFEQLLNFFFQPLLFFLHALVAHRLVFGGVGLDFRAV